MSGKEWIGVLATAVGLVALLGFIMRGCTQAEQERAVKLRGASQWEFVDTHTVRRRVPGGWIVRYINRHGVAFVPDADHDWDQGE